MKSLIQQRNAWFLESRRMVDESLKKRKPKSYKEVVLVNIIKMFIGKNQAGLTLEFFLDDGYCRYKDFGFKRRCLNNFFKYGVISPEMEHTMKQIPKKTRVIFDRVNDRTDWMKDRLYRKKEPYA
jgi:hypothetical protein